MEPSFSDVIVEVAKPRDYCLSDTHPRGRREARVFRSRLGLGAENAQFLLAAHVDAVRGQVGTVVENLAPGVFDVEFSDDQGRVYAQLALDEGQLLALHYAPQQAA